MGRLVLFDDEEVVCKEASSIGVKAICVGRESPGCLRLKHIVQMVEAFNEKDSLPEELESRDVSMSQQVDQKVKEQVFEGIKAEEAKVETAIVTKLSERDALEVATALDTHMREESEIIEEARNLGHSIDAPPFAGKDRPRHLSRTEDGIGCRLSAAGTAASPGNGSGYRLSIAGAGLGLYPACLRRGP